MCLLQFVKKRPLLLRFKFRITRFLPGSRQFALTQRTFDEITLDSDLTIRASSHLITSVALTVISTPDAERDLTKFFTTAVLIYAEETPRVSLSP